MHTTQEQGCEDVTHCVFLDRFQVREFSQCIAEDSVTIYWTLRSHPQRADRDSMAFATSSTLDVPPFQLQQLVPLVFDFDVPDSGLGTLTSRSQAVCGLC